MPRVLDAEPCAGTVSAGQAFGEHSGTALDQLPEGRQEAELLPRRVKPALHAKKRTVKVVPWVLETVPLPGASNSGQLFGTHDGFAADQAPVLKHCVVWLPTKQKP